MQTKILLKIINRTPVWIYETIDMLIHFAISYFFKAKYKDCWLISDTGEAANDNGFAFFKYMCKEQPEVNVFFVISQRSKDYEEAKLHGKTVDFMSFDHKVAFILSSKILSAHMWHIQPWSYKIYKQIIDRKSSKKAVFLQHGITQNNLSNSLSKSKSLIDLFTTAAQREQDSLSNNYHYGYHKGEVVLTGFARYDNLKDFKTKKEILFIPSWRNEFITQTFLGDKWVSPTEFKESNYFKKIHSLLNNSSLHELLEQNDYTFVFYTHYKMQRYLNLFSSSSNRVQIKSYKDANIQDLMKESELMITDFSSVFFDFAYMRKSLVYYQFDPLHYQPDYFSYLNDGFGDIITNEGTLISYIQNNIELQFQINEKYTERADNFFRFNDTKNCERIFEAVIKI